MSRFRLSLVVCLAGLTFNVCSNAFAGQVSQDDSADLGSTQGVAFAASNAVPLDSWVYPAMDRLAALGYLPGVQQGMRPWTRLQCARLLDHAQRNFAQAGRDEDDSEAAMFLARLSDEFLNETELLRGAPSRGAGVTSLYVRGTQIGGPPLRDAFHFGQTIADDFGRPYGQGFNAIAGTEVHAEYGMFSVALRGEYQDSRALFQYNDAALVAIASMDALPIQSLPNTTSLSRPRLVEATFSMKALGWQASFGEESQWWGQGRSTSLLLSNNAEAPVLLRIQRDKSLQLPGFLAYLGQINNTFFIGQLRGQHFIRGPVQAPTIYGSATKTLNPQPFLWGDQLDFKVSPNLELGFELVCMWAGYGRPATLGTWLHTFSFQGNGQPVDPGKRFGGFQFAYRLPHLRDVTLYADMMANDEPTPIDYPHESAMNPGLYIARLPRLSHMDLRVEGVYTNIPDYADGVGSVYFNQRYASGYRNAGQLMGSWVGRAGTAVDAKTTYWISPAQEIDLSFRRQFNDRHMIGGGGLDDIGLHSSWQLRNLWHIEGGVTVERWKFPVLRDTPATTVAATIGVVYTPRYGSAKF